MNTLKPTLDNRPHDAIHGLSGGLIPVMPDMDTLPPAWDDGAIPMFDQDVDDDYSLTEELEFFRHENEYGLD